MEKQFLNTISKYAMINNGDTIVVGLSGGCDSVAMFTLLQKYKEQLGINIIAVHVNHLVRTDSHLDEKFCVNLCKKYNTPIYTYQIDIEEIAKTKKLSSEEVGRLERYKAFNNHALNDSYKIAVAHNKNDVAETFLMNLFRGAGISGLKSIAPVRDNIIRPIIEIERNDLENFLKSISQPYCTDSTNLLPIYTRNKVRLNLIPTIKEDFNNNIVSTIYDTTKILEEEDDFIQSITEATYGDIVSSKENNILTLDVEKLLKLHPFLQKQIIIKAISTFIHHNQNISKKHINSILSIISTPNDGEKRLDLPHNLIITKSYNNLTFKTHVESGSIQEQSLVLEKLVYVPEIDKYIYAKNLTEDEYINLRYNILNPMDLVLYENKSKVSKLNIVKSQIFCYYSVYDYLQLKVRSRRIGDVIYLKNLGSKKLKDYFIDKKIPKENRDSIPLITLDNDVLWVLDNFNTVNNKYLINTEHRMVIILMEEN